MSEELKPASDQREAFEAWWRSTKLGDRNEAWQGWKAAIAHAVPRWIPASERLPTIDDADEDGNVLAYECPLGTEVCQWTWLGLVGIGYTHWMPSPKVPA